MMLSILSKIDHFNISLLKVHCVGFQIATNRLWEHFPLITVILLYSIWGNGMNGNFLVLISISSGLI